MMSALGLSAIARLVDATFAGPERSIAGAAIDSRQVAPGDLFVAVAGAQADGHDYIGKAADAGAAAALVEADRDEAIPCLRVADSLSALTRIGAANRDYYQGELVAVTGSNGKTSVKNLCEAIFSGAGSTIATAGNYNNEIGVPLTLTRLNDETQYAIVEMGATRRGDIAHLCRLARPTVSTVLNAMEAHLEGFGSVADVADVKAEIFDDLGPDGTAVVNLDQEWSSLWEHRASAAGARVVRWSTEKPADVYCTDVSDDGLVASVFTLHVYAESAQVTLPLPGNHNVANAVAAAALAVAAGLSLKTIATGLERVRAVPGRVQAEQFADGLTLIDDSYNANPGSVRAAIKLLGNSGEASTLILGEMLELGDESAACHREMGELAREQGIDGFIGVGPALAVAVEAFGERGRWYADREALVADLDSALGETAVVLVKGSRGAAMESVVRAIRDQKESLAC